MASWPLAPTVSSLWVVGASPWDDLYPNVKYRVAQIEALSCDDLEVVTDVAKLRAANHVGQGVSGYLRYGLSTIRSVLGVVARVVRAQPDQIYVTYPTPVVLFLLRLLGQHRRSRISADLFIAISETLIEDRGKVRSGSMGARFLTALERFTLKGVTCLVDTEESGAYLAQFFGLDPDQFQACPLALAPRPQRTTTAASNASSTTDTPYAYFVGTLVPLQGAPLLVDAYLDAARHSSLLPLVLRGDGQDGPKLAVQLAANETAVDWRRELAASAVVETEIADADLCIGVFGSSAKAQRVLAFKVYQYLRAGKAIVTLDSPALRRIEAQFLATDPGPSPFYLVGLDDLPHQLRNVLGPDGQGSELAAKSASAARLFEQQLSNSAASARLRQLFCVDAA